MYSYRISKYNPKYRNIDGVYMKNEWTSYVDIGNTFDGKEFSKTEYLKMEEQYIIFFINLFKYLNIERFYIYKLENYQTVNKIDKELKMYEISLSKTQRDIMKNIKNGDEFDINFLPDVIILLMRDCIWCEISDKNKTIKINIGYELYFHIMSISKIDFLENKSNYDDIYVEKNWKLWDKINKVVDDIRNE